MGYWNSFCISKIKWIAFPMKKNLSVIRNQRKYENKVDKKRGKIGELTIQFQETSSNWTSWTTELEAKKNAYMRII